MSSERSIHARIAHSLERHSTLVMRGRYFRRWMTVALQSGCAPVSKLSSIGGASSENSSSITEDDGHSVPVPQVLKGAAMLSASGKGVAAGSAGRNSSSSGKPSERSMQDLVHAIEAQQKQLESKDRLINYLTSQRDIAVSATQDKDSVVLAADLQQTCRSLQSQVKELQVSNKVLQAANTTLSRTDGNTRQTASAGGGGKKEGKGFTNTTTSSAVSRTMSPAAASSPKAPPVANDGSPSTAHGSPTDPMVPTSDAPTSGAVVRMQQRRATTGAQQQVVAHRRSNSQQLNSSAVGSTPQSAASVTMRVVEPPAPSSPTSSAKALGFTQVNAHSHPKASAITNTRVHAAFGRSPASADTTRDGTNGGGGSKKQVGKKKSEPTTPSPQSPATTAIDEANATKIRQMLRQASNQSQDGASTVNARKSQSHSYFVASRMSKMQQQQQNNSNANNMIVASPPDCAPKIATPPNGSSGVVALPDLNSSNPTVAVRKV